jgi:hypothetical protein
MNVSGGRMKKKNIEDKEGGDNEALYVSLAYFSSMKGITPK